MEKVICLPRMGFLGNIDKFSKANLQVQKCSKFWWQKSNFWPNSGIDLFMKSVLGNAVASKNEILQVCQHVSNVFSSRVCLKIRSAVIIILPSFICGWLAQESDITEMLSDIRTGIYILRIPG